MRIREYTKRPQTEFVGMMMPRFADELKKPVRNRMGPVEVYHVHLGHYTCGRCDKLHQVGYRFGIGLN